MNTNKYSSFLQDDYHFNSSRLITPHFDKHVKKSDSETENMLIKRKSFFMNGIFNAFLHIFAHKTESNPTLNRV